MINLENEFYVHNRLKIIDIWNEQKKNYTHATPDQKVPQNILPFESGLISSAIPHTIYTIKEPPSKQNCSARKKKNSTEFKI